jgi:WD40 repeat protein
MNRNNEKKWQHLLLVFALFSSSKLIAQESSIYAADTPSVVNVWNRVGDFSPMLRSVESAALSPDGKWAVSVSKFDGKLMAWRVADGFLRYEQALEAEIECVVFSPDGKRFATGGEDFYLRIYETETGRELKNLLNDSSFDGIAWSHDGKTIAGGTEKGDVVLLDAITLKTIKRINVGSTVNSLQFTRNDLRLVAGGNIQTPDPQSKTTIYSGFVKLLDLNSYQVIRSYEGPKGSVKSVRISSNEQLIAAGSFDNAAYLFELETGKMLYRFPEPKKIEAIAFSPNDHFLLVGGHQKCISFYRLKDYQLVYQLPTPRTEYIDLSADGRLLLTAHEDSGMVSLYMFLSDMQDKGPLYHQLEQKLLKNKDLKND